MLSTVAGYWFVAMALLRRAKTATTVIPKMMATVARKHVNARAVAVMALFNLISRPATTVSPMLAVAAMPIAQAWEAAPHAGMVWPALS